MDGAGGNDLILGGTGNDIVSMIAEAVFYTAVDAGSENDMVLLFSEQGGYNLTATGMIQFMPPTEPAHCWQQTTRSMVEQAMTQSFLAEA